MTSTSTVEPPVVSRTPRHRGRRGIEDQVRSIRGWLIALLVAAALTGCARAGAGSTPAVTTPATRSVASGGSGIAGVIQLDDCPMMRYSECDPMAVPGRFAVVDADTGAVVTTVTAGADGRFRVSLPPGQYVVRLQTTGAFEGGETMLVAVSPGQFLTLTLRYQTSMSSRMT
jgi:hypothetical protein